MKKYNSFKEMPVVLKALTILVAIIVMPIATPIAILYVIVYRIFNKICHVSSEKVESITNDVAGVILHNIYNISNIAQVGNLVITKEKKFSIFDGILDNSITLGQYYIVDTSVYIYTDALYKQSKGNIVRYLLLLVNTMVHEVRHHEQYTTNTFDLYKERDVNYLDRSYEIDARMFAKKHTLPIAIKSIIAIVKKR